MTRIVLPSLLLLAAGCGTIFPIPLPVPDGGLTTDGGSTGTDAGLPPRDAGLSPDEVCRTLNAARCTYLGRCGLVGNDAQAQERCRLALEATWCGPSTWPAHVLAGALRLDGARAADCASALDAAACAGWASLPDSCTRFLLPRVPLGQPCYDGYVECLDGVCRGAACPRTCQPRGLLGEVCSVDGDCRAGLFCRQLVSGAGVGQCATLHTENEVCLNDANCGEGLRCVEDFCRKLPGEGQPCLLGRCDEGLACRDVEGVRTCQPRLETGSPCAGDECEAGLVCEPLSGQCERLELQTGDACGLKQRCPQSLVCVGVTSAARGKCDPPLGLGLACLGAQDCEAHLVCATGEADAGLTCLLRRSAGEPCVTSGECQLSARCVGGTCVELPLPGEPCATTRACRWGLCRMGNVDGGFVCGSLLGPGSPCTTNAECASGQCSFGTCLARCVP